MRSAKNNSDLPESTNGDYWSSYMSHVFPDNVQQCLSSESKVTCAINNNKNFQVTKVSNFLDVAVKSEQTIKSK